MKKLCIVSLIVLLLASIVSTSLTVYADSTKVYNGKEEIVNYFNDNFLRWGPKLVPDTNEDEFGETVNYDNLFRVYRFKESEENPFKENHSNLEEMVNFEDDIWIFNIFETGNQLIVGKNGDNEWEAGTGTPYARYYSENNPDTDYTLSGMINNIEMSHPDYDEESLFYIWDNMWLGGTVIEVFNDGGKEYAACYFVYQPPMSYPYKSGEIVESSEVLNYLNAENGKTWETERNGMRLYGGRGEAISESSTNVAANNNNIALYIGIASAILIVSIAFVVNKRHTKKNKSV